MRVFTLRPDNFVGISLLQDSVSGTACWAIRHVQRAADLAERGQHAGDADQGVRLGRGHVQAQRRAHHRRYAPKGRPQRSPCNISIVLHFNGYVKQLDRPTVCRPRCPCCKYGHHTNALGRR